ncbi:MAG: type IV pilin protein [Pseudomonas oryzihabitans]
MKPALGFTLIELLIAMAIVAILATIGYPGYQEYVRNANRAEGQSLLLDAAARQERFFAQNNAYVTSQANLAQLQLKATTISGTGASATTMVRSETGKYQLEVGHVDGDGGYSLTAKPQFDDGARCGDLTLNAIGVKGRTLTATGGSGSAKSVQDCWR